MGRPLATEMVAADGPRKAPTFGATLDIDHLAVTKEAHINGTAYCQRLPFSLV
jgi:hypothetical protein